MRDTQAPSDSPYFAIYGISEPESLPMRAVSAHMDPINVEITDPKAIIARAVAEPALPEEGPSPVAYVIRASDGDRPFVIAPFHEDVCLFFEQADWWGQTVSTEEAKKIIGDNMVSIMISEDGGDVEWCYTSDPLFDGYLAKAEISEMATES